MKCAFSIAWAKLRVRIEDKTTWGKNELKNLMFECLHEGAEEHHDEAPHD